MKKYLSVILGMILTACLVACGSSEKNSVNDNNQERISNQEVSDTKEQETQERLQNYLQKKRLLIFLKSFLRICILQMI